MQWWSSWKLFIVGAYWTGNLIDRWEFVRGIIFVLFLVEKSLGNNNCLIDCLIACLCVRRVKRTLTWDFQEKTCLRVSRCGELESEVGLVTWLTAWAVTMGNWEQPIRIEFWEKCISWGFSMRGTRIRGRTGHMTHCLSGCYSLCRREESSKLANINCLLACFYVRTSLIGPRIMWKQKGLFSINLDQR